MRYATVFSSCRNLDRGLEMLAHFLDSEGAPHECPETSDVINLRAEIQDRLAGSSIVLIAIDGDGNEPAQAIRTLMHASKSHPSAIIVTKGAWSATLAQLQALPATEQKMLTHRTACAILIGENGVADFPGFEVYFSTGTKVLPMDTVGWTHSDCEKIAAHIRTSTARN